ncbi:MAG: YCII-related protein [Caulobacter sp.]|nr:YCII-related protein [Caulobacter sp.]
MALFVLNCTDKAGSLDLRMATRPTHLDYLNGRSEQVKLAGPLLDPDGNPIGSMLVIDAADLAAARAFADADPYARAGLFSAVTVSAFRIVFGGVT